MSSGKLFAVSLLISAGILASTSVMAEEVSKPEPLVIQEQGSFAVGGTVDYRARHVRSREAAEPCRADLPRRPSLCVLPDPGHAAAIPDRDVARIWSVLEDMGDDCGRSRRVSEYLSAPQLPCLSHRPAASRQRRPQHRRDDDPAEAGRAILVRSVPCRRLAGLFRGRAVPARSGSVEPVLPRDDAEYRVRST